MPSLTVELVPSAELKYFRCDWLSPFSHEGELLFCGGFGWINFLNITNTAFGCDFQQYIMSLRIIDTMTNNAYLMPDPADIHQMSKHNSYDVF